ncbi:hypothetical protein T492DRAFT_325361 [Pavlovales sp. CCMP2436]|nr:hypothetical protein T492DRAFT_325361 [Pavlovales sp. CCMP2436]
MFSCDGALLRSLVRPAPNRAGQRAAPSSTARPSRCRSRMSARSASTGCPSHSAGSPRPCARRRRIRASAPTFPSIGSARRQKFSATAMISARVSCSRGRHWRCCAPLATRGQPMTTCRRVTPRSTGLKRSATIWRTFPTRPAPRWRVLSSACRDLQSRRNSTIS